MTASSGGLSGSLERVGYSYDSAGNRISESAGGVTGRRYSYETGNYLINIADEEANRESPVEQEIP